MRAPDRFRFRPPAIEFDRETRWCLLRAFGPPDHPCESGPVDPSRTVEVANALDVGARIATRIPLATLQAELGPDAARQLLIAQAWTRTMTARAMTLAREVATSIDALGARGALLKGTALVATGVADAGSRAIGDLDVLVARETVPALQAALIERGFAPIHTRRCEQHAIPLSRGQHELVETHVLLLGVRLEAQRTWADLPGLDASGHLLPVNGWPAAITVPDRGVMLAHLIAHGLAHHAYAPGEYPLARILQDLIDLDAHHLAGDDWEQVAAAVAGGISARELRATTDLCAALAAGEPPAPASGSTDAHQLLRHIVVGALDPNYRKILQVLSLRELPLSGFRGVARNITDGVFLSRSQVDAIYGPQRSWVGYALLRLWRPFDLVRRTVLYGWRAVMQRR